MLMPLRVFGVWASVTLMYLSYQTRKVALDKLLVFSAARNLRVLTI